MTLTPKKRSHHAAVSSRPHRIEVMFSDSEWDILNARISEAANGTRLTRSQYLRIMALKGKIIQPLTFKERQDISALHGLHSILVELILASKNNKIGLNASDLEKIRNEVHQISIHYQNKLSK